MKHTDKYQFRIIEDTDTFSPDPINANTESVETQLAALAGADAALQTTLTATKTALQNDLTAAQTALRNDLTAAKTALQNDLTAAQTALRTAMGSAGRTCRIEWGQYTGNGNYGRNYPNKVTPTIYPMVVFVTNTVNSGHIILIRDMTGTGGMYDGSSVSWDGHTVSWYHSNSSSGVSYQMNVNGWTYNWIAIGYDDSKG